LVLAVLLVQLVMLETMDQTHLRFRKQRLVEEKDLKDMLLVVKMLEMVDLEVVADISVILLDQELLDKDILVVILQEQLVHLEVVVQEQQEPQQQIQQQDLEV
jgi:hypothetical protein